MRKTKRHAVIPDVQAKHGVNFKYLSYGGQYIAEQKPDVIVCIGDFADMPSLSSHDKPGTKGMEGKRYKLDIAAPQEAMETLMAPIQLEMKRSGWQPRLVLTLGNHEDRIARAIKNDPKLDGLISIDDLQYEKWGWEVYPYLEPVTIDGVVYAHYFCSGIMGRPVTTARALLTKKHMSCFAGHQQGKDRADSYRADGKRLTAIIAGSYYEHDEDYLNHQTNNHWRGLFILNEVHEGSFDDMAVSLEYLRSRYGSPVCPRCHHTEAQSRQNRWCCKSCNKFWPKGDV
jgi:hypothetical protein